MDKKYIGKVNSILMLRRLLWLSDSEGQKGVFHIMAVTVMQTQGLALSAGVTKTVGHKRIAAKRVNCVCKRALWWKEKPPKEISLAVRANYGRNATLRLQFSYGRKYRLRPQTTFKNVVLSFSLDFNLLNQKILVRKKPWIQRTCSSPHYLNSSLRTQWIP